MYFKPFTEIKMILIKTIHELTILLEIERQQNRSIGFVPTMGALHAGHLALLNAAKLQAGCSVCSIFVNPTQFNNAHDFEKYPITIEKDIDMLEANGCDILFLPPITEIYPEHHRTKIYDLGYIETVLEGTFRPGHYQGVCQVVDKLLSIVAPDKLFLGQKDYQQCMVIRKMLEIEPHIAEVVIVPTVREADGLAMSSRNLRLNIQQREKAVLVSRTLFNIKETFKPGPTDQLQSSAVEALVSHGFKPDYVAIADAVTLEPIGNWNGNTPAVALIAAYMDDIRLIDNVLLN